MNSHWYPIKPEINRAMTLKESSKIGSFFCVIFATDIVLMEITSRCIVAQGRDYVTRFIIG